MSNPIKLEIAVPEKFEPLFFSNRYKVFYGGRGGAKSWSFARALIVRSIQRKTRILCTREFQLSIQESVYALLEAQIEELGLLPFFRLRQTSITGLNGSEFIFAGLRSNVRQIKSMEGLDVVWVEEADKVSDDSWSVLIPTVRKKDSEIWISFNPGLPTDPTWKRFVENPPPDSVVVKVGWEDNPWLPEPLKAEKDYLYDIDPEAADHIWGGGFEPPKFGRVYKGFRREVHVCPVEYKSCLDLILACDFNVHAMRWLVCQLSRTELTVLDEIALGQNETTESAAREFVRRWNCGFHRGNVIITGDATGKARHTSSTRTDYQTIIDECRAANFASVRQLVGERNPPVEERVAAVNWHLLGRGVDIRISPTCKKLITDLEMVTYRAGSSDLDKSDPELTHASDGLGYLVWNMMRPTPAQQPPAARLIHERTGNSIMDEIF